MNTITGKVLANWFQKDAEASFHVLHYLLWQHWIIVDAKTAHFSPIHCSLITPWMVFQAIIWHEYWHFSVVPSSPLHLSSLCKYDCQACSSKPDEYKIYLDRCPPARILYWYLHTGRLEPSGLDTRPPISLIHIPLSNFNLSWFRLVCGPLRSFI